MKVLKFLATGLLLCATAVFGQVTAPTPISFKINDILYPDSTDERLLVETPPYVRVEKQRGKIILGAQTDSTELDSLAKGQPRVWTLAVRTKTATAVSGVDRVTFRRYQAGYGTTGTWPDTTITVRHNEAVLDVFPGVDFTFHDADSMAVGDTVRVWLLNKQFAAADNRGILKVTMPDTNVVSINANDTVKVLSTYPYDTLTVATFDTLPATGVDTFYSTVTSGRYGTVAMYIDGIELTNTAIRVGVGLQYKRNGWGVWYGADNSKVHIHNADILFPDSSYAAQLMTIPADSLRVAYWDVDTAGRSIIRRILLFFGD